MTRSRYLSWTVQGPYRKPSLLSRWLNWCAWFVGVGALVLVSGCSFQYSCNCKSTPAVRTADAGVP